MAHKKKTRMTRRRRKQVTPRRVRGTRRDRALAREFGYGAGGRSRRSALDRPLRDLIPIDPLCVEVALPVKPTKKPVLTWRQQGRRIIIQIRDFLNV